MEASIARCTDLKLITDGPPSRSEKLQLAAARCESCAARGQRHAECSAACSFIPWLFVSGCSVRNFSYGRRLSGTLVRRLAIFKRVPARPRRLVCSIRKFSSLFSSRDVRKVERLASFRQRGPCVAQTGIMFALFGVVCFLGQRGALGGRFPCDFALRSHLVLSYFEELAPPALYIATTAERLRARCRSLFLAQENVAEAALV